jgi:hypothetical protein
VDQIVEQLKDRTAAELFKIIKEATKYAEKASKDAPKRGTRKATKKSSDVPLSPEEAEKAAKRGAQLDKPRAWVTYVGNDARANGWSAFPAKVTAKDKVTGLKTESVVEMPASVEKDGVHVFPDGKAFNHKHAMSLSKSYWVAKTKVGSRQDLYAAFEAQYVAPVRGSASAPSSAAASDAEEDDETETPSAAAAPAPKPKKAAPKKAAAPKAEEWKPRADGKFTPWVFNGRPVRRNKDNYLVGKDDDGEDEWLGVYNPETNECEECDIPDDFAM